jgi:hypothetical protein
MRKHSQGPINQNTFKQQIPPKTKPVSFSNTVPHPRTVMVIQSNADITIFAVLRS